MASLTKGIFIVAAKRTPFGIFGGKLVDKTCVELQEIVCKAALVAGKVDPSIVDSVVVGNVLNSSAVDAPYVSRHVLLKCGIPVDRPAYTVNRLCGSGFQSIICGIHEIFMGDSRIVLTGGTENMSQSPYSIRNLRFGSKIGTKHDLEDTLWASLTHPYCASPMLSAEHMSEKWGINRAECDEYAYQSMQRWVVAQQSGWLKEEIVPVGVKVRGQSVEFAVDEHPRPKTTMEQLGKLVPIYKKGGTVTAGTASGICDGAGSVIIASDQALKDHNLTPLARIVAYSAIGVDPKYMGIGPVPAIKILLKLTGKTLADIDLIEINEAFSAQVICCVRELDIDMAKLNVNGGAISLGHPLAATAQRITAHLVHELRRRRAKLAIGAVCIGGGQGMGLMLERV